MKKRVAKQFLKIMPNGTQKAKGDGAAVKQKGTEKTKRSPLSCPRGATENRRGRARYLSQPVWSDILSPGRTVAAAGSAAGSAADAVSSACATFGKTFETYLTSSTRPAARPGQSPSVRAASAFSPGFPWRRRPGP